MALSPNKLDQLLQAVRDNPGKNYVDYADMIKASPHQVSQALHRVTQAQALVSAGLVGISSKGFQIPVFARVNIGSNEKRPEIPYVEQERRSTALELVRAPIPTGDAYVDNLALKHHEATVKAIGTGNKKPTKRQKEAADFMAEVGDFRNMQLAASMDMVHNPCSITNSISLLNCQRLCNGLSTPMGSKPFKLSTRSEHGLLQLKSGGLNSD